MESESLMTEEDPQDQEVDGSPFKLPHSETDHYEINVV
jgi:hypothetical protein